MEVLLLQDIVGIGKKNDLLNVAHGYALNYLLPRRLALVATPAVRRQYGEMIKKRAEERAAEKALQESLAEALTGKVVHIQSKTAKGGKLYAQVSEQMIVDALQAEYSVTLPAHAIRIAEQIKTAGTHTVQVTLGAKSTPLTIDVAATESKKK